MTDKELTAIADLARRQGELLGREADRLKERFEERWMKDEDTGAQPGAQNA